jgi:hypothetical protein
MPKCEKCGKEFSGEHALKIHKGKMHGSKKKAKGAKRGRKAARPFTCPDCGRSFGMSMHLARHRAAAHAAAPRKARGRLAAVSAAARNIGVELGDMTIDQLLNLRDAVSDRLVDIARRLRGIGRRS